MQSRAWIAQGVAAKDIGVAARTAGGLEPVRRALQRAGLPTRDLGPDEPEPAPDAVALATMHRMKGLELRCVAVVDASAASLPHPQGLTPAGEDAVAHAQDIQRKRCLVYVACTRAREQLRVSWSGHPSPLLAPVIDQG